MQQIRINGVELAYELRGAGAPLVMIHGAQGDQSMFNSVVPAFVNRFQVLTFDQRGSGLSEKPDQACSMAMLADDTAALMDHVGFTSAHILGVSMGGMIAQEFVLCHPQKTRSLVLGCTTPGGTGRPARRTSQRWCACQSVFDATHVSGRTRTCVSRGMLH